MSCPVLAGLALAELAELADQFCPPDPAPPILVKLVEAIEQAGEGPADCLGCELRPTQGHPGLCTGGG